MYKIIRELLNEKLDLLKKNIYDIF